MKTLYTLSIGHTDAPAAEIFTSERAALARRLELSEVSDEQRERLIYLFNSGDRETFQEALDDLESQVSIVCSIEEHRHWE